MAFLSLGSSGEQDNSGEKTPTFEALHRSMLASEVNLADNHTKLIYGKIHWERLLHNMHKARFDEALRIAADRHE